MKNDKKKLLFVVPESLKGYEFQVAFSKYIEELNQAFLIDMNQVELKAPTGTLVEMEPFFGMKLSLGPIIKEEEDEMD